MFVHQFFAHQFEFYFHKIKFYSSFFFSLKPPISSFNCRTIFFHKCIISARGSNDLFFFFHISFSYHFLFLFASRNENRKKLYPFDGINIFLKDSEMLPLFFWEAIIFLMIGRVPGFHSPRNHWKT